MKDKKIFKNLICGIAIATYNRCVFDGDTEEVGLYLGKYVLR